MESNYETSFGLILNAGNARSKSLMAIEAARDGEFEQAEQLVKEAEQDLRLAHQTQTDLIQKVANGQTLGVNLILIHAQDHLTMAMIMVDQAKEFIHIYRLLNKEK